MLKVFRVLSSAMLVHNIPTYTEGHADKIFLVPWKNYIRTTSFFYEEHEY